MVVFFLMFVGVKLMWNLINLPMVINETWFQFRTFYIFFVHVFVNYESTEPLFLNEILLNFKTFYFIPVKKKCIVGFFCCWKNSTVGDFRERAIDRVSGWANKMNEWERARIEEKKELIDNFYRILFHLWKFVVVITTTAIAATS